MPGSKKQLSSQSSLSTPDPALRWFGKLPTYGDYYSSPTDGDWTVEFHDWFLEGFVMFRNRSSATNNPGSGVPRSSWVIRLPGSNVTVLASIADYGGDSQGRPFPLCFYVGVPTATWPGPTDDTVMGAVRVWDRLAGAHDEVDRLIGSSKNVEQIFSPRDIDIAALCDGSTDDSWRAVAGATSLDQWFAGASELLRTKELASWVRALREWGQAIGTLDSASLDATFRLPLSAAAPFDVQVAGWLRWLASYMDFGSRNFSLAVTANTTQSSGNLSVITRRVTTEDFLLATSAHETLSYVDDACSLESVVGDVGGDSADAVPPPTGESCWLDLIEGHVGGP